MTPCLGSLAERSLKQPFRGSPLMPPSVPLAVGLSVDEFMAYDTPDGKAELVRGELRLSPSPGGPHGLVVAALAARLFAYVEARRLGRILTNASFELVRLPRTVRAPDI